MMLLGEEFRLGAAATPPHRIELVSDDFAE
jgi:hypothetical protein